MTCLSQKNVWKSDKSWEPDLNLSLSLSLTLVIMNFWTTFVFMSMLKSHSLTLSMSHSFTLSFTHSPHAEQLLISWEWLLSIDMKTKVVQYDMREWETALQPCNLFIFQQNFEALGVVFHPPPQNVKLGSGVKLLKSFGLIQIGLLCEELWP